MTTAVPVSLRPLGPFGRIRDLLALFRAIAEIDQPISSPEGLRQSIAALVRLAELVGIDEQWSSRLEAILNDPHTFDVVLAIVRFIFGLTGSEEAGSDVRLTVSDDRHVVVSTASFIEWLPLVVQLISLLQAIRRARGQAVASETC